jgi:hypothetical protein
MTKSAVDLTFNTRFTAKTCKSHETLSGALRAKKFPADVGDLYQNRNRSGKATLRYQNCLDENGKFAGKKS